MEKEIRKIDEEFDHPFGRYEVVEEDEKVTTDLFFKANINYGTKRIICQRILNCATNNLDPFAVILTEDGEAFFWYEVKPRQVKGIRIETEARIIQ